MYIWNHLCTLIIKNKKKDIWNLYKGSLYDLDDTTLTAEKEYSVDFTEQQKKFFIEEVYKFIL